MEGAYYTIYGSRVPALRVCVARMLLHFAAVLFFHRVIVAGADCPLCDTSTCPNLCLDEQIPDLCGCCPFRCANSEGDVCSDVQPCRKDLICDTAASGRRCLCRFDRRMVCGSNNQTYNSVCHLNYENNTSEVEIEHWGPCEFGPEIHSGPIETRGEVGMPVAFDCEARGAPVPAITWSYTGRDGVTKILPGDDQQIAVQVRGGPEQLMVTSWLQIVEASPANEGTYTCEASSSRGTVSADAFLLIRHHL